MSRSLKAKNQSTVRDANRTAFDQKHTSIDSHRKNHIRKSLYILFFLISFNQKHMEEICPQLSMSGNEPLLPPVTLLLLPFPFISHLHWIILYYLLKCPIVHPLNDIWACCGVINMYFHSCQSLPTTHTSTFPSCSIPPRWEILRESLLSKKHKQPCEDLSRGYPTAPEGIWWHFRSSGTSVHAHTRL